MEKLIDKTLKPLASLTAILGLALALLILFWSFYPYVVTKYTSQLLTERTEYTQGDDTFYRVSYCKYMDLKPEVSKHFVDGLIFNAEQTSANLEMGCSGQAVYLHIPSTLPPGNYHIEIELKYQVNPIRTVTVKNTSNWFTVKANPNNDLDE